VYIAKEYDQLEYALDNDHYESAYEIVSNIRRTITLIKNTRRELDALDVALDEVWEAERAEDTV
jgi:hypothetical protein